MIKAVIFDLDGTLFKGKTVIDGAADTLKQLRKAGLKIIFLSNAGTETREGLAKKLAGFGIEAHKDEVYNTSYGTARYIVEKFGAGTTFYAVSEPAFLEELKAAGLVFKEDKPRVVVATFDRNMTYDKVAKAYLAIKSGAVFIATNLDKLYPIENGFLPGGGSVVAAVQNAAGVKPIVIGKPESYMIDCALADNKIKKSEALLVGDMLDTDIAAAKNARIKSAIVLTGITSKEDLEKEKKLKPDIVMDSIIRLPSMLSAL
jgi:HAD superfamily hydrolase (TIGR01457 family)